MVKWYQVFNEWPRHEDVWGSGPFLTSALDGDELALLRRGRFTAEKSTQHPCLLSRLHTESETRECSMPPQLFFNCLFNGSSPSIIRVIKSRRMRWAGHAARMEEEECI
jgi:hypothetical protein